MERRDEPLDVGIADRRAELIDLAEVPLDELRDTVLRRLAPRIGDDRSR